MAIQLPLSQLLQPVPLESWKQRIVDIAKRVGLKTDNWSTGGFMRTLVALFAEFHTMNVGQSVRDMHLAADNLHLAIAHIDGHVRVYKMGDKA